MEMGVPVIVLASSLRQTNVVVIEFIQWSESEKVSHPGSRALLKHTHEKDP